MATLAIGVLVGVALVELAVVLQTNSAPYTVTGERSFSTTTITVTQTLLPRTSQLGVEHGYVEIGGTTLLVEIADEPDELGRGLSGRQTLAPGWGMLFVFDKPGRHSFWMYGMLFPLDMIWFDKEGKVVHIVTNAQPCPQQGQCPSYTPELEALYVLEVSAGFASEQNITVGMSAEIYLRR